MPSTSGRGVAYEKGRDGLHSLKIVNTNNTLKHVSEGGFSSKLEIECPTEAGS